MVPKENSLKKNYRSEFLQSSFIFVTYLLKGVYRKIKSEIYFVAKLDMRILQRLALKCNIEREIFKKEPFSSKSCLEQVGLRCLLKQSIFKITLRSKGRAFHNDGPEWTKARSPKDLHFVFETCSSLWLSDRKE